MCIPFLKMCHFLKCWTLYSMPITLHFAICNFSCPENVFSSLPRQPPDRIITAFITFVFIGSIFSLMAIQTCFNISIYSLQKFLVAEIKTALRHTNRPIEFPTANNHTCKMDATGYLWHDGVQSLIKSLVLALCQSPTTIPSAIPRLTRAIMFQVHFFCLTHNKNSLRQCSIFLQIHDSENFFDYEGVNTTSEGVLQALLENLGRRHHAYIEWIHYICLFNFG
jgi:hypothetical protein